MVMIRHINELRHRKSLKGWQVRVLTPDEAARARAEDSHERNAHRLPPEAYTRFLLQAKDGEIPPGEADRRITKFGGSAQVRPLRRK